VANAPAPDSSGQAQGGGEGRDPRLVATVNGSLGGVDGSGLSRSLLRGLGVLAAFPETGQGRGVGEVAVELEMTRSSWGGGEAPVSLATGGFLAAARRTGLAGSSASGSPQDVRCPLLDSWSGVGGLGPIGELGFPGGRPRRGDVVSAVTVPFDSYLAGPVEPCAVGACPVTPPVPSLDLCPGQPLVLLAQPSDYSPPQVVVEIAKAARCGPVVMVVGPTPQAWVERVDQFVEREARRVTSGQLLDAVLDVPECLLARERVGGGQSTVSGVAHCALPQEVEAVVYMGDRCLFGRERESHVLTHELGCLLLDLLGVSFGAIYQDHEVVRVADHSVA
jgi:hypothetical protein